MKEDINGARVHLTLARTVVELVPREAAAPNAERVADVKERLEADYGDEPITWRKELLRTLAKLRRIRAEPGSRDADDLVKAEVQIAEALRAVGGDPEHAEHVRDEPDDAGTS